MGPAPSSRARAALQEGQACFASRLLPNSAVAVVPEKELGPYHMVLEESPNFPRVPSSHTEDGNSPEG